MALLGVVCSCRQNGSLKVRRLVKTAAKFMVLRGASALLGPPTAVVSKGLTISRLPHLISRPRARMLGPASALFFNLRRTPTIPPSVGTESDKCLSSRIHQDFTFIRFTDSFFYFRVPIYLFTQ